MIRCIILDDEPLAREVLVNFVGRTPALQLVATCANAVTAFALLHSQAVDLLFVDIKLPDINGLEFIRSLKHPPAVIFTTAFADYAVTGFELEAVDYLLKPITFERFEKSVHKLLKIYRPEPIHQKAYTYFKVSGQLRKIFHEELLYAQSVKDYILLYTTEGNYLTHMTMKYLSELLPSPPFGRVHRSYLVNTSFIDVIDKDYVGLGKAIIPVGELYRDNLNQID
jgi:two-component system LytT family response regulator